MDTEPHWANVDPDVAEQRHGMGRKTNINDPIADAPTDPRPTVAPASGAQLTARTQAHARWFMVMWLLALMFTIEGSTTWVLAGSVSASQGAVTEVRSLYTSEWGVPYPVGLVYIPDDNHLALLANMDASGPIIDNASIVAISPYEELVGAISLPFTVENAINLAYDDATDHLLFLDQVTAEVIRIPTKSHGRCGAAYLPRTDISHLGLGQVEGMVVDTTTRRLFILDSSISAVVIADMDNGFTLLSVVELADLPATDLRGLSLHPSTHTLFVTSPSQGLLFEVTVAGDLLNTYDLGPLAPINVRGLTFGPSADLTDAPDTIHLFIADSGVSDTGIPFGRVVEAALSPGESTGNVMPSLPSSANDEESETSP